MGKQKGRMTRKNTRKGKEKSKTRIVVGAKEDAKTHIYICGLRAMEQGVESALTSIAESIGEQWHDLRDNMRQQGRYHVETY